MLIVCGLAFLFLSNVLLVTLSGRREGAGAPGSGAIIALLSPFQEAVTRAVDFTGTAWDHYFFLVAVSQQNMRLKKDLDRALQALSLCTETQRSHMSATRMFEFARTVPHQLLAAKVVGADPSLWFRSAVINRGESHGVREGFPVIAPEGVVGRIVQVTDRYAKVLLIIDPTCAVDARLQRTRARGIVEGSADGLCRLKYVLQKEDVRVGDAVISSGLDGIFPEGFRVGYVSSVGKGDRDMFHEVTVMPSVAFGRLEDVLVVMNPPRTPFPDVS